MNSTLLKVLEMVKAEAPTVLAGLSAATTVGAALLSAKATPKALQLIDEKEWDEHRLLTAKEKAKLTWKEYIPAGVLAAVSIGSSLSGNGISLGQQAQLMNMVSAGEMLINKYQDKITEKYGEEDAEAIRTEISRESAAEKIKTLNPGDAPEKLIPSDAGIFETGLGSEIIYDDFLGRFMRSSEAAILDKAANFNLNLDAYFTPVSQFYWDINIRPGNVCNSLGFREGYKLLPQFVDDEYGLFRIMSFENRPRNELGLKSVDLPY